MADAVFGLLKGASDYYKCLKQTLVNISTQKNGENGDYFSELLVPLMCLLFLIVFIFDVNVFYTFPPETKSEWMRFIATIGISPLIIIGFIGVLRYLWYSDEE